MSAPFTIDTFKTWFDRQGIKHFNSQEFTNYFEVNRHGAQNTPPPKALWANIVPTLRIVDRLRSELNVPIVINSSYRNSAYNTACGGASRSEHKDFKALDISVSGYNPSEVHRKLLAMRNAGDFSGGLGLYNTFVHIDTRGYNANW